MRFLKLAMAAVAIVLAVGFIGCAGEETTPADQPPATEPAPVE